MPQTRVEAEENNTMPRIPITQFSPSATGPTSARADPGMYDAMGAAGRSFGQALANTGETINQFAAKKQEATNYATFVDADRQLKESFAGFQDELQKRGDESNWVPDWQKRQVEVEKQLGVEKMAPVVRERLGPQLAVWRSQTTMQVRSQVTAREISRAKGQIEVAAELDVKNGDIDSYVEKIKGGEQRGLFSPHEAEAMIASGKSKAEYYAATDAILADPLVAMEALKARTGDDGKEFANFTAVDPVQRKTLIDAANVAVQRVRAETYQGLIDRMNSSEVIGDRELNSLVDRKLMTATQARDIARNQGKNGGLAAGKSGAFAEVLTSINAYDPRNDGTNERYADLAVQVATLPPGLKEDAYSRLKEKRDPASPLNSQVARDAMQTVDASFKAGLFGQYEVTTQDPATGAFVKKTDAKAFAGALDRKVKIEDALTEYFRANPKATRTDALAYVSKIQEADVAKQGAAFFVAPETQRLQTTPAPTEVDAILLKYGKPKK